MAKKADLAAAYHDHLAACERARAAAAGKDFAAALRLATAAIPTLREAVEYQRRYVAPPPPTTPAADLILRLAPPLFGRMSLDALESELGGWKRSDRGSCPDLPARIADARADLTGALRLWAVLTADPPRPPPPGLPDGVLAVWVEMGLVTHVRLAGSLVTRPVTDLRRATCGKCSECGRPIEAPAIALLAPYPCPACGRDREFVIVRRLV